MGGLMGGGDSGFAFRMIIFALVIMMVMPLMINIFVPSQALNVDNETVMDDYYNFTGAARGHTKESVWVLTGVYTPYEGGNYNYTEDGWLYGARINTYTPTQYEDTHETFTVSRDSDIGIYRYYGDSRDYDATTGTGHKDGSYYTSVVFDRNQKSDIFFSPQAKYDSSGNKYDPTKTNEPFYYSYTGWRYAFQPTSDAWTSNADGDQVFITATTSSLSLIWYSYYTSTGISGQLVLSGNDSGVAYLTGDQIVGAFDSTTNTARFNMTFNGGVEMGIYIRIDPWYLTNGGYTIKQCYDLGYWSIMVTSISTDAAAYVGTDNPLNIAKIFETLVNLMTFDYTSYNMSEAMGYLCSFIIVIPLYAGLIALAINNIPILIFTGVLAAIESIALVIKNWTSWFGIIGPNININDAIAVVLELIGT